VKALGTEHMRLDQRVQWLQHGCAGADKVGQRRPAQIDAFPGIELACRFKGRCWSNFSNRVIASRFGPAKPRSVTWNGA
jgi:hypothetical protein